MLLGQTSIPFRVHWRRPEDSPQSPRISPNPARGRAANRGANREDARRGRQLQGGPSVFHCLHSSAGSAETMSDGETVRHNVRMARRIAEYWRRQGVEIELSDDPTKDLRSVL